jgi:hypothetical protein
MQEIALRVNGATVCLIFLLEGFQQSGESGPLSSILGRRVTSPSFVSQRSATPGCRYFRRCSRTGSLQVESPDLVCDAGLNPALLFEFRADARQPRSHMERRYTAVFL